MTANPGGLSTMLNFPGCFDKFESCNDYKNRNKTGGLRNIVEGLYLVYNVTKKRIFLSKNCTSFQDCCISECSEL